MREVIKNLNLTTAQATILDKIETYTKADKIITMAQLAKELGYASTSGIQRHIISLVKKRRLIKKDGHYRTPYPIHKSWENTPYRPFGLYLKKEQS